MPAGRDLPVSGRGLRALLAGRMSHGLLIALADHAWPATAAIMPLQNL
jgi:hypothetical protein